MPISDPGSRRTQLSVYALAFFTGNLFPMISVIIPLWVLQLSASPFLIGLVIASRQILAITFSIHGGTLLDRFDPRKVILVLGLAGAAATALYPALPFVWAAILLQMITGFAETTNWIGAQSLVGRLLQGGAVYAGRMTAAARFGGFAGPILSGLAWQAWGPYGGFGFVAAWMLCGVVTTLFVPAVDMPESASPPGPAAAKEAGIGKFLPNPADYASTLRLLLLPAVALVIAATFMRQAGSGIQSSFYGVWLSEAGFSAGIIGMLIGVGNLVSAGAALSIGPLIRRFNEHWLLLAVILLAIVSIAITPMLDTVAVLLIAISFRGVGQGLNLPLMLSIASRAVGRDFQGRVAALRIAFNRLGSMLVPVVMGAIAQFFGLETAFYVVGISGVALIGLLAIWMSRQPDLKRSRSAA